MVRALGWLVGSLLLVAHPRLPASLITQASDSLIERSQFMNIFQPWLKRQVVLALDVPKRMVPTRTDINLANLQYQRRCMRMRHYTVALAQKTIHVVDLLDLLGGSTCCATVAFGIMKRDTSE